MAFCAATAMVLVGAGVFAWRALGARWPPGDEARSTARADAPDQATRTELVHMAFLGPDGRTLEEETREVALRRSTGAAAVAILEELRGGSRQGRGAVLPKAVQVRHVFVDGRGVAYVDLSGHVLGDSSFVVYRRISGGAPLGMAVSPASSRC